MKYVVPLVLFLGGCADHLPLVGAPCPCATGTVCDEQTQTCVLATAATEPDGGWLPDGKFVEGDDPPAIGADHDPVLKEACERLGYHNKDEVDEFFIVHRCGSAGCHQAIFPPRNLNMRDMFRTQLVDVKALSLCKSDYYINRTNPKLSYMLTKVVSQTVDTQCPSGGAPDSGGTRMPNSVPAVAGPRLSDDEIGCYTWWIMEMAR